MIARKSLVTISTSIIDGGLGYLGLFFIARYMNPADYGIVSFAIGFVSLFTIFTNFGFISSHIKRVSEGKNLGECIGTFLTIRTILIILTILILLISLHIWKNFLGRGFETPQHLTAVYILLVFWIIQQIIRSFSATFQAKREIAKLQIPYILSAIVRTSAIIYVALSDLGALALAWTYVAGECSHILITFIFFKKYPIKKPNKQLIKSYSVFAFPLAIVATSSIIMSNIDKVLIQLFWNSNDVGYYFAAYRVSDFITMFTTAIGLIIFPTYSMLHSKGKINQIKKLTFESERQLSIIVFPMVLGLIVLAEPTAFILLSGWMPAAQLLQILPMLALFKTLSTPYEAQFNGMNKPKINRNRVIIMVICNLILNFLLIPKDIQSIGVNLFGLGAKGAAIATVISFAVGLIYCRIMAYRISGTKINKHIFIHALAAIIMSLLLFVLLYYYELITWITRWYHLLFFAVIGFSIYMSILILFKEFTKKDFYFYLDTLNIRKMGEYIKEEFGKK